MERVKRVEIITTSLELDKVLDSLNSLNVSGYSVIRNVIGKGSRGIADDDIEIGILSNVYVLTTCPPENVQMLVERIQPILKKFGGVCLVSDAEWIIH
jgi:nitrogen regulatory protein PII